MLQCVAHILRARQTKKDLEAIFSDDDDGRTVSNIPESNRIHLFIVCPLLLVWKARGTNKTRDIKVLFLGSAEPSTYAARRAG